MSKTFGNPDQRSFDLSLKSSADNKTWRSWWLRRHQFDNDDSGKEQLCIITSWEVLCKMVERILERWIIISNFGAVYFSGQNEEFSPGHDNFWARVGISWWPGPACAVCTPPHSHSCSSQSNPTSGPVFLHVCVCVRVFVCVFWCVCVLSQVLKSSWSYFWVKTSCPSGQSLCLWLLLSKILLTWRVLFTLLDIKLGRADVGYCATLNFSTFVTLSTFYKGLSFSTSRKCNKRLTFNSEQSHCAKWTWERHLSGVVHSVRQLSREFEKSWHLLSLSQTCQNVICISIVWGFCKLLTT